MMIGGGLYLRDIGGAFGSGLLGLGILAIPGSVLRGGTALVEDAHLGCLVLPCRQHSDLLEAEMLAHFVAEVLGLRASARRRRELNVRRELCHERPRICKIPRPPVHSSNLPPRLGIASRIESSAAPWWQHDSDSGVCQRHSGVAIRDARGCIQDD